MEGTCTSQEEETFYLAALARVPGLGSVHLRKISVSCPDPKRIWEMPAAELIHLGMPSRVAEHLQDYRSQEPDAPKRLAEDCQRIGARVISLAQEEYPEVLREIFAPPVVLYCRGSVIPDARRVAMVGSRRLSPYGEGVAGEFAERIAAAGVTVVSGGARGIDTCSHKGALKSGRTVAVLGCGIDVAYPRENRRLFQQILEQGAVISEYGPGTQPLPAFFPARNRIISGLAEGTIVIEAARRSGSLITAEMALSEGRNVYAVPGSIWSDTSAGCHHLIQQGAKLVTGPGDVLEDFGIADVPQRRRRPQMTQEERKIWQVLSFEHPLSAEEILMSLPDGEMANLSYVLLQMEFKGLVLENELHAFRRAERE